MDKREELIARLILILNVIRDCDIKDLDKNLFGIDYNYSSGEILDVCMELQSRYNIDMNIFIGNIKEFTVNNMAEALEKSMQGV